MIGNFEKSRVELGEYMSLPIDEGPLLIIHGIAGLATFFKELHLRRYTRHHIKPVVYMEYTSVLHRGMKLVGESGRTYILIAPLVQRSILMCGRRLNGRTKRMSLLSNIRSLITALRKGGLLFEKRWRGRDSFSLQNLSARWSMSFPRVPTWN